MESWKDWKPSPIELMHGTLLDEFHKFRLKHTNDLYIKISGKEFNEIVVKAKKVVYNEYPELKNPQR